MKLWCKIVSYIMLAVFFVGVSSLDSNSKLVIVMCIVPLAWLSLIAYANGWFTIVPKR